MNATRFALDAYGLRRELLSLTRRKNFLFTPVWPEYAQVIEFYKSDACLGALTDSGGLQEELNMLGKVCLTCRFNTDRPETVREAGGNLLVPPVDADFVFRMVDFVLRNRGLQERMRHAKKLYGTRAGEKFVAEIQKLICKGAKPFIWSHERLGFWREKDTRKTML